MDIRNDDGQNFAQDSIDEKAADQFATEMDDVLLDIADLDPTACPPDQRIAKGDREAWVYHHGNIAELVFVKLS